MKKHRKWGLPLVALGLAGLIHGCSGSSSRGGASTTTAPITTQQTTVASIESLLVTGPLLSGDVPVAFRLAHPNSVAHDVEVHWSADQGRTWSIATAASGSVTLTALPSAPAPGLEHVFRWDSAADIPGFEPDVVLRVTAVGGTDRTSASHPVDNQQVSTHVLLNRHPYLQDTRTDAVTIAWRTESNADSVIEWGPTAALGQQAGSSQASTQEHWVTLSGLSAGTTYYYRVVESGLPLTPRYTLETAPDPAIAPGQQPIKFVVVGDSGMGNPEQYAIANLMAAEQADFFLHTGDVVYPAGGFPAAVVEYNRRFFEPYRDMLHGVPAFPVVGNHDLYGLLGQPFKDTFQLPDNGSGFLRELYYAFDWGDARFIAIESNTLWKHVGFGPHINWLEDELQNNQKKWLIAYMHAPPYSAGHHGDEPDLQRRLQPLFEQHGVDLVLTGHDHNYERTVPIKQFNQNPNYPGLVHIVTGGGGASLRPVTPNARTAVALSVHHYMRIEIQGDWLTGEAVDINGQVVDRFQIRDQ